MAKKKLGATNSIKRFIKKIGGKIVATNDDTQYTLLKRKSNSWNIDKDGVAGLMSDLGVGGGGSASEVTYDNTESGLTATTTQGAIDESVEALHSIDNALIVNNKHFYFDEHNGVLGMNTSELRGADTFTPFIKAYSEMAILINNSSVNTNTTIVIQGKSARYVNTNTSIETDYMRIFRSATNSTRIINKANKNMKYGIYRPANVSGSGVMNYQEVTIAAGSDIINATGSYGYAVVVPII